MVDREREEQAPLFHDSWHRLHWVERQIATVRELAEPWSDVPERAVIRVATDEAASRDGHFEFVVSVPAPPDLPTDINFIVGNLVTDARSCLDMAVDGLWKHYGLDPNVKPQFPLEDDFEQKRQSSRAMRRFLDSLDPRFVEVIEQAQPDYRGGMVDIPSNISAIFIGHLSNANKHRNITPVVPQIGLRMFGTDKDGLHLRPLDRDERHGVPPVRFELDYDTALHSREDIVGYIRNLESPRQGPLRATFSQRLVVDRQEIPLYPPRFGGQKLDWFTDLNDLLTKVPAYVRLTLRNLNRVHAVIQGGDDDHFYLLDSNARL